MLIAEAPTQPTMEQVGYVVAVVFYILGAVAAIATIAAAIYTIFRRKPVGEDLVVQSQLVDLRREFDTQIKNCATRTEVDKLTTAVEKCASREEVKELKAQLKETGHVLKDNINGLSLKVGILQNSMEHNDKALVVVTTKLDTVHDATLKLLMLAEKNKTPPPPTILSPKHGERP